MPLPLRDGCCFERNITMKKIIFLLCLSVVMMLSGCNSQATSDTNTPTQTPTEIQTEIQTQAETSTLSAVTDVQDGTYRIDVRSSSSMFKIVDCELTVTDGKMTAVMTLSGKGYEKLFMGTAEQAENADKEQYLFFKENADGKYTYTVPVEALDKEIDCCAFSFKKQKWYDRVLVFQSDSLQKKDK